MQPPLCVIHVKGFKAGETAALSLAIRGSQARDEVCKLKELWHPSGGRRSSAGGQKRAGAAN